MKNYLKFVVAVFGVTVATLGSLEAKATAVLSIRCTGDSGACAKLADGGTMLGKRSVVN